MIKKVDPKPIVPFTLVVEPNTGIFSLAFDIVFDIGFVVPRICSIFFLHILQERSEKRLM